MDNTRLLFIFSALCAMSLCISAESVLILEGAERTLQCGFENIPIVWDYQDSTGEHELIAVTVQSGNDQVDDARRFRLEPDGSLTKLTLLNVTNESRGTYRCIKFHDQSQKQSWEVDIAVRPRQLAIQQTEAAEEGDLYSLTCVINPVKPTPNVTWTISYMDGRKFDMTHQSVISTITNNDGTLKVLSSIGVELKRDVQDALFACTTELSVIGHGAIFHEEVATYMINAYFAPASLQMHGVEEKTLEAGREYVMVCTSDRSNPPADIVWYKDGQTLSITEIQINYFTGYYVTTSYLKLTLTPEDNNSTIECRSSNYLTLKYGDEPLSTNRTLNVDYAPVLGAWIHNKTVDEGDSLELDCVVKYSKPHAEIRWIHDNITVDTSEDNYQTYPYPNTKWMSLTIKQASWRDVGNWRCEASNYLGAAVSSHIHISVAHRPICKQNVTYATGEVGELSRLNCSMQATPNTDVNITWFMHDNVIKQGLAQTFKGDDSTAYHILPYMPSSLADVGPFYCEASNSFGKSPWKCKIEIIYISAVTETSSIANYIAVASSNTQSYIIIGFCCLTVVLIAIVIVIIILAKKRGNINVNEKHSSERSTLSMHRDNRPSNSTSERSDQTYGGVMNELKSDFHSTRKLRSLSSLPSNSIGRASVYEPTPSINSAELEISSPAIGSSRPLSGERNSYHSELMNGVSEIYNAESGEMTEHSSPEKDDLYAKVNKERILQEVQL